MHTDFQIGIRKLEFLFVSDEAEVLPPENGRRIPQLRELVVERIKVNLWESMKL